MTPDDYPDALDPDAVGTYDAVAEAGGGYGQRCPGSGVPTESEPLSR